MQHTPNIYDFDSIDEFLQALIDYESLIGQADQRLAEMGLTVAGLLIGIREIDEERTARNLAGADDAEHGTAITGALEGARCRYWVVVWHAHGLSVRQVAILVGREPGVIDALTVEIDAYLTNRPKVLNERLVVELHRAGMTPVEIAAHTGMVRSSVHKILDRLGMLPHARQRRAPDPIRNGVIRDRNRGMKYPDLRRKYGVTTNQIRSILRYAAKQGLVKGYGETEESSDAS